MQKDQAISTKLISWKLYVVNFNLVSCLVFRNKDRQIFLLENCRSSAMHVIFYNGYFETEKPVKLRNFIKS